MGFAPLIDSSTANSPARSWSAPAMRCGDLARSLPGSLRLGPSAHAPSVDREVVGTLVHAGAFLLDLHEDVVQQRGGADAEELGRHPFGPQRLVEQDQVVDGLLRLPNPPGGLEAGAAARFVV